MDMAYCCFPLHAPHFGQCWETQRSPPGKHMQLQMGRHIHKYANITSNTHIIDTHKHGSVCVSPILMILMAQMNSDEPADSSSVGNLFSQLEVSSNDGFCKQNRTNMKCQTPNQKEHVTFRVPLFDTYTYTLNTHQKRSQIPIPSPFLMPCPAAVALDPLAPPSLSCPAPDILRACSHVQWQAKQPSDRPTKLASKKANKRVQGTWRLTC